MPKKMYVVYCEDYGTYWCGLNTWDTQLRKAQVFHSLKYANDVHERFKELRLKNVEIRMERVPENPTHADRIRAMTDEELARFIANKIVNLENHKMIEQGHTPTATQLSALGHTCYCTLVQWLKKPAEGDA